MSATSALQATPAAPIAVREGGWGGALLTPRRSNILLALLLCGILPTVTARAMPDLFNGSQALLLTTATATVAAAIALNILMGYAGQISLGHAALLGVGAFTSGLLTSNAGIPLGFTTIPGGQSMLIGIPAAAITGALVALVIGFPALRLRGLYLAIVTIGFGYAVEQSIFRMPALTRGSAGIELPRRMFARPVASGLTGFLHDRLHLGFSIPASLDLNADFLAFALLVVVIIWVVDENILRSRLGRAFHGIREDEAVAQSFAIDVSRYKLLAFVISGAVAGVAGALYGHAVLFTNNEQWTLVGPTLLSSLGLVIVVVVGGLGSRLAVVIAAAGFTLFPRLLGAVHLHAGTFDIHVDAGIGVIVGAGLLVLTVVQHPGGFAEILSEARERRAAGRQPAAKSGDEEDEVEEQGKVPSLPVLPRPVAATQAHAPSSAPIVLEVHDLSVRFGGLLAVHNASLTVPRGKIVGLIGPNGAGKSTVFNAISGFVRPESGAIRLDGQEIQRLPPHRRAQMGLGRTFQNIGLAKNLSVLENFMLSQHAAGGYGSIAAMLRTPRVARVERELENRGRDAIAALGFERFTEAPLRNLSHGQQRIVELGCVLVTDPEVLMLDEPSSGMSPGAAENLAARLRDLRDELQRTVLLIEHNVPLVLDVCDYIYVLNYGEVLAHGTTEEIARQPEVIAAYFGEMAA